MRPLKTSSVKQEALDFGKQTKVRLELNIRLEPDEGIDWIEFVKRTGGKRKWEK